MYVVGNWIERNVGHLSFGDWCSSPRKEKNSKPPTGGNVFPCKETIKVNPNRGKQRGIPEKESPGIANNQSDPNGRQTELVPRRPQKNSNMDPSGSNSEVRTKAKRNPWKESTFEFQAQVRSDQAPKGNKFLSAWGNFLGRVRFLRRDESEQKGNHYEASAREFCASRISWGSVQLLCRSVDQNSEFKTMNVF